MKEETTDKIEKINNHVRISLKTVNLIADCETDVYEFPITPDSEYVVDDSNFIPMSEAVKQLGANNNGSSIKDSAYYDFPDGIDNGMEVPITRTKNGKDIAEISSAIMDGVNDISEKLEKNRKELEKRSAFEKELNAATGNNTTLKD